MTTGAHTQDVDPRWSSDGLYATFASSRGPGRAPFRLNLRRRLDKDPGRELYFVAPDGTLMAVAVAPGSPPRFGEPRPLMQMQPAHGAEGTLDTYAPAPDGQRFLALEPLQEQPRGTFNVIVNWQRLLMSPSGAPRP